MKQIQSQIESLKEMLSLEEKRQALQQQIDSLTERLTALNRSLFQGGDAPKASATPAPAATAPKASKKSAAPRAKKASAGRSSRGELKDRVFAALESAGHAGVRVKELAGSLGTKPVNIHAWFHAALKRYPNIQKIVGGHYRLKSGGAVSEKTSVAKAAPKASKKTAARKSSPSTSSNGSSGRSPRGELTNKIVAELSAAGKKGRNIKELSEKVGAPYKNISIWFATTGKKNRLVKKIGRGLYSLA